MPDSNVIQMPFVHDAVLDNQIRAYKVEMLSVGDMPVRELFSGFDTLRAITFSASANFVDRIVGLFEYAEIVVGAEFLVRKNAGLHDAMYQSLAAAKLAGEIPEKYPNIGDRMRAGAFQLKVANVCLDHRKLYILSSRDGRTRVVITSANMSGAAWSGEHMEHYEYADVRRPDVPAGEHGQDLHGGGHAAAHDGAEAPRQQGRRGGRGEDDPRRAGGREVHAVPVRRDQ